MIRRLGLLLICCLVGLSVGRATALAQTADGLVAVITSPIPGQQLFGQVQIQGSAGHPSLFASYTLEYDDLSDPALQWFLAQERVSQQVDNNVLGVWNTTLVPDGSYQLRLRVFLTDGQVGEYTVSNLRVVNTEPTPIPTVTGDQAIATASGPTPAAPLIEQPPSNNPTATLSAETIPSISPTPIVEESGGSSSTRVNFSRVRSAFCSGVYLALALFAVLFVYSLLRGPLRPYTHRALWQSSDDFDNNQS
ncbi:MAG TPA: hypothetical protein VHP83_03035 [Aggregatilineaceae bacterium]|nr:hypothetical protein [Aggregatilineaceae bacterium]